MRYSMPFIKFYSPRIKGLRREKREANFALHQIKLLPKLARSDFYM